MVGSQVRQVSVAVPFPTVFRGVVGPGFCFPYKALLAETSLLGSGKDQSRLLGVVSEEGQ